jgi:type I restriction enzyme, S subunit
MSAPVEWRFVRLGQLAEVRTGLSKNRGREGPTITRPYLRVANVQDGRLDLSDVQEIDVPSAQVARFTLQKGDLLLIEGNGNPENLGRGCLWNGQIPGAVHQNHVFAVRVRPDAGLLPKFLELQVQSDFGRGYFLSSAKGSTGLSTLNSRQIDAFPIYLPPINVQERIVSTVGEWTRSIEVTERLIGAKRLCRSEIGERLLNGSKANRVKLREATRESVRRNGSAFGRMHIMGVTNDRGMRPMREETVASSIERYKVVRPCAFAYNPMRLNIGSIAMSPFDREVLVSPDYVVFECDETKLLPGYLNHLRLTRRWSTFFDVAGSGSVRVRIYYDDLAIFTIPLPSVEEQRRLVEVLDTAVAEIDVLTKYAEALRKQKRGLMQKLLNGQWRVPVAEPEAA